ICNGLFVSNRTLDQIYGEELKLHQSPVQPPSNVFIDYKKKTVQVGGLGNGTAPMRAVYREGLGAVMLAPDQTFADIDGLPELKMPSLTGDPKTIAWPDGDLVVPKKLPKGVSQAALDAAGDWAFDRNKNGHFSQITLSVLVIYKGEIIYERYAPGVDYTTKTRTWSTAKSIGSTLIGIAVGEGKLKLDDPLPWEWPSLDFGSAENDPRKAITLRNSMHMSSGLYPVDNEKSYSVGSWLSYFGGASVVKGAVDRGLIQTPGTRWDYENFDTILGIYALKQGLGDKKTYLEYPRTKLFDKIGMRSTIPGVDRFGDYILSSQVYTNARDLGRLGLLYLNKGKWNGEQILPASWVDFVRTPAPSTAKRGNFYGGQWWLVPDNRDDVPQDAYSTAGHRGQYTVVLPSYDLVIVRRGLDWLSSEHPFSQWDLTREVLKALPKEKWGNKPAPNPAVGSE
ncbi:MAG: serine hydrolase, partial [Cyclobacteriaceae bacterium]